MLNYFDNLTERDIKKILSNSTDKINSIEKNNDIDDALQYGLSLIGTKYKYWHLNDVILNVGAPFWAENKSVPSIEEVKNQSCTCTGLINLMRRKVGSSVPGVLEKNQYAGGTYVWFEYLNKKDVLESFDINKKYPKGTLLIRQYFDEADQGHVAVIVTEGQTNVLYEELLHCYSDSPFDENDFNKVEPGVSITPNVGISHFTIPGGYYTHICLPEKWLFI